VITRIKMAEDSAIKIVVSADGKYFSNSKKVIVLENGCG
jgi:predicted secreted protein